MDYTSYNPKIAIGFQPHSMRVSEVRQFMFIRSINLRMTAFSLREVVFQPFEAKASKRLETLCTTLIRLYISGKNLGKQTLKCLKTVPIAVHNAMGGYVPNPPPHKCHVAVRYSHKILHNYECLYGKGDTI